MGKLNVKNGTPVGNAHLCRSCSWGQVITGYRESDMLAICTNTNPNVILPFTVMECGGYSDKYKPDWDQMQKLAIHVAPTRLSKTAGFSTAVVVRPSEITEDEEEDETEAASVR